MNLRSMKLGSWIDFRIGTRMADVLTRFVEARTPPDLRLIDMSSAFEQAQCVYVAAKLGVAEQLLEGPKDAETLAEALGVQPDPLFRVLRYLHGLGVFGMDGDGRFELNQVSQYLLAEHPQSQRDIVLLSGEEAYAAWGNLLHAVQTGESAWIHTHGARTWELHEQRPEFAKVFDGAMVAVSAIPDQAVAADYDFAAFQQVADLGGGRGNLLRQILTRHLEVKGILFDTASVLNEALQAEWRDDPLNERVTLQVGDFFGELPGDVDAYILKDVVHNWPDDKVVQMYENIHRAMRPDAKLLVLELVIAAGDPMGRIKLNLDVNMLVVHNGRERTVEEHRALLERAGFRLARVVPTRSIISVLEAERA